MSNKQLQAKDIRDLLADFMHDIEEWQSLIEGSPTRKDMEKLDKIYKRSEKNIRSRIVSESGAKVSNV